ncbi:Lcl C-terminal domain-containing protein [Pseudoalteromonas sp. T1lg23B]|uniref:Lcl C-terminal domain-containing protein n=1 Tax=Pseudoalteromonas sp. T1lg23B TaxID=2077097 RepID=UPI000CF71F27|nr:DUF1566 domain-containing protein [Pseudoalteromonas sp. T1lg23B]
MIKRFLISVLIVAVAGVYVIFSDTIIEPIAHPRYTKITAQGKALSPWQGPWACVLDHQHNLLWEVKTDDESIHDGYWTYSWYDHGLGKANFGDCYFEDARCDTQDLIRHTNQQALCGQNNWRLPTEYELASLIQPPKRPGQPYIAYDYFAHIKKGDYWTSKAKVKLQQQFAHLKQGAKAVNFHSGEVVSLPYRNAAFVILVSDITGTYSHTQLSSRDTSTTQ